MSGDKKVLLYHYRGKDCGLVKDGLDVITEKKLTDILEDNNNLQASTKEIEPGAKSFSIYQKDLYTTSQDAAFKSKPNYNDNLAGITLPDNFLNVGYSELTILSHKRGDT